MFCFHTLPWYCKGSVIAYDVFRCLLLRKDVSQTLSPGSVLEATFSVFGLQAMVAVLLLAPSVVLSVADRGADECVLLADAPVVESVSTPDQGHARGPGVRRARLLLAAVL